ncbi:UNVERIFIED_CONTAM: hypothetical protein NCL1_57275 [Trichonephila clavipes]
MWNFPKIRCTVERRLSERQLTGASNIGTKGEKDYNDDHRDEITAFVQSTPGFQECNEGKKTWMAIDAKDSVDFKC